MYLSELPTQTSSLPGNWGVSNCSTYNGVWLCDAKVSIHRDLTLYYKKRTNLIGMIIIKSIAKQPVRFVKNQVSEKVIKKLVFY